ncbi:MAG: tRNA (adenosine(37)-N6)-dimethylallyltransferase MiaA [Campylobacterota bacterium]|nr:tRNA (adenosine(37)-N6)-dimethylallyltransferase MiaA [Campylobacterota bacterium]
MKQIAIIGPTASGKSDVALELAHKYNAYILSIDSLSIYKEIDIASAKPSKDELNHVKHFGINEIFANEHFDVSNFIDYYHKAKEFAINSGKNLIIVGGTSFYLKSLLSGISKLPAIDDATNLHVKELMKDSASVYAELLAVDKEHMKNISSSDSYRIEKMMLIYRASGVIPSLWFQQNPAKPIITDLPIFEIDVSRDVLRERISHRTKKMVSMGLIDEVAYLEQKYSRASNAMSAIGIVEVLEYLDGLTTKDEMTELISTHTAQLAKRQQTFNRSQFERKRLFTLEHIIQQAESSME